MQVSVIIPVYNAAPFLHKSIQSALYQKQTGEVLLIDDRSTDDSLEICKKWELKDSRVKVFVNEGTKGAGAARNVGLHFATCEYIAFLDADDYYLEGRFDEDKLLFDKYLNIDAVSSAVLILTHDKNDHFILNTNYGNQNIIAYNKQFTPIKIDELILLSDIYMHGCTFSRAFINKLGGFDENLKQCQDTDLIWRAVCEGKIFSSSNKPKTVYYIHTSNTIKNENETLVYRLKFAKKSFWYMKSNRVLWKINLKILKTYCELWFLEIFRKQTRYKKLKKIFLLPFILYQLIKTDD